MLKTEKQNAAVHVADRDVLKGPPGLLLGLTLLVFVAARLCFGWDTPSASDSQPKSRVQNTVQISDKAPPSMASRGDTLFRNR